MASLPDSVWLPLLLGCLFACGGEGSRSRLADSAAPVSGSATGATPSAVPLQPSSGPLAPEQPLSEQSGSDANGQLVLDDLTDGDARFAATGISGEWFTYSDGTSQVSPPDHTGLIVSGGETHVSGQGFSDWGVGLSAYLRSADLSPFCSLKLTARGSGPIVIEIATPATSPPGKGGTCMGAGCFGHFATSIQLEPAYRDYDLEFGAFAQPSWAQPAQLSLSGVISFNLVAKVGGAPASIDLWVDRLALQTCP